MRIEETCYCNMEETCINTQSAMLLCLLCVQPYSNVFKRVSVDAFASECGVEEDFNNINITIISYGPRVRMQS